MKEPIGRRVHIRARNHVCKGAPAGNNAIVSPPHRRDSSRSLGQAHRHVLTWGRLRPWPPCPLCLKISEAQSQGQDSSALNS